MHPALESLAITPQDLQAAHISEADALKRLLSDALLFNRCIFAFLELHAADLIQNNFHELERQKLRDKLVPRHMPVKHEVRWSVNPPLLGCRFFIRAICATCHQSSLWDSEPKYITAEISQCNQKIPLDVLQSYRAKWVLPTELSPDECAMR